MNATFPVFPGMASGKTTTRWLLAGLEEQRRRQEKPAQHPVFEVVPEQALFAGTA
jgi:hypothetical protein